MATLTLEQWTCTLVDFDGMCAYCQKVKFDVIEHFVPIAVAGTVVSNCIPACYKCNYKKSDHTGDTLRELFGKTTIDRISQYLISRSGKGIIVLPSEVQRKQRWSTRRKTAYADHAYIEEKPVYSLRELCDMLPIPLAELARRSRINQRTLLRLRDGKQGQTSTVDRLLAALSVFYGRTFTMQNVVLRKEAEACQ